MSDPKDLTAIRDAESALVFDEQANESGPPYKSKSEMKRVEAREFWVQAEGFQSSDYLMNVARIPIDLTNQGENRWIFTVIQTVNPYPNPVSNQKKWLHLVERSAYDSVVAELAELRLAKPNAGSTDTLTEKYRLRRERDQLKAELAEAKERERGDINQLAAMCNEVVKLRSACEMLAAALNNAIKAGEYVALGSPLEELRDFNGRMGPAREALAQYEALKRQLAGEEK